MEAQPIVGARGKRQCRAAVISEITKTRLGAQVVANKQDLGDSQPASDVSQALGLKSIRE